MDLDPGLATSIVAKVIRRRRRTPRSTVGSNVYVALNVKGGNKVNVYDLDALDSNTPRPIWNRLDLYDFGVELMASNLRRRHPNASPAELEQQLDDWLVNHPGSALEGERFVTDRFR